MAPTGSESDEEKIMGKDSTFRGAEGNILDWHERAVGGPVRDGAESIDPGIRGVGFSVCRAGTARQAGQLENA
jgi:hypothetical protein